MKTQYLLMLIVILTTSAFFPGCTSPQVNSDITSITVYEKGYIHHGGGIWTSNYIETNEGRFWFERENIDQYDPLVIGEDYLIEYHTPPHTWKNNRDDHKYVDWVQPN